jgi:hypothetical protein
LNEVFRRTLALSGTLLNLIASTGRYVREKLPRLRLPAEHFDQKLPGEISLLE